MKNRRNLVAVVLVIGLGTLAFWLVVNNGKGSLKKDESDFAVTDTAAITKIFLADKSGKSSHVTLTRTKDGWMLDGEMHARPDAIKTLLETIHDIRPKSPVGPKARENVIKWLATGSTKIEIYQGESLAKVYYIGGPTQDNLGTYMLLADKDDPLDPTKNAKMPYVTEVPGHNGYLTPRYFTSAGEWRDRTVFNLIPPQIRSVRVEHYVHPEQSFVYTQSTPGRYTLASLTGSPLPSDSARMRQYSTYFINAQYEGVATEVTKEKRDSILASKPACIVTVTDVNNIRYELQMFVKKNDASQDTSGGNKVLPYDPDRMYGWIQRTNRNANDPNNFVVIQWPIFGKIAEPAAYFAPNSTITEPEVPGILRQRAQQPSQPAATPTDKHSR